MAKPRPGGGDPDVQPDDSCHGYAGPSRASGQSAAAEVRSVDSEQGATAAPMEYNDDFFDIPGINGEEDELGAGSDTSEELNEYEDGDFPGGAAVAQTQMMVASEEHFPTLEEELLAAGVDMTASMEEMQGDDDMEPLVEETGARSGVKGALSFPKETSHIVALPSQEHQAAVTKKGVAVAESRTYQSCVVEKQNVTRARLESSDLSDGESCYDTVSSASSTASLLRKSVREHQTDLRKEATDQSEGDRVHSRKPQMTINTKLPCRSPSFGSQDYLDPMFSAGSGQALLAKTLEQVKRSLEELSPTFVKEDAKPEEKHAAQKKNTYLKNLIVLSLGFMLVYTAFFSLRNLQSSINHEAGLGLVAMSCLYGTFVVGCMFASSIINNMRPKWAILAAMCGHLVFTVANFYPTYYSLLPAVSLLGFTMATLWTAQGTYITSIAVTYAAIAGKNHDTILGLFNGFFLFLIQIAQILGNLVSSTVFYLHLGDKNGTTANDFRAADPGMCGARYCHSYKIESAGSSGLQHQMLYILLAVFTAFTSLGVLMLGVCLDKLDVIFHRNRGGSGGQLLAMFQLHRQARLLLLLPFMVYLGMEEALLYGEITKAFITCPLGLHWIGYVMMCFGACNALSSFLCGSLQRCVHRTVIMGTGAVINCGLLALMYMWTPSSVLAVFLLVGGWGVADGIWQTQACSLCALLFPKQREPAFASLRMYEAIGFTIAFAYAQFLCMDVKLLLTGGLLGLAVLSYLLLTIVNGRTSAKDKTPSYV